MKQLAVLMMLALLPLLLLGCSIGAADEGTTHPMVVLEKGHTGEGGYYWISAYDKYNEVNGSTYIIKVEDELVWNLIETNKEYALTLKGETEDSASLHYIEYPVLGLQQVQ